MANVLYISASETKSGKSALVLGIMQVLLQNIGKVAIFRPIINTPPDKGRDHDIDLILKHFELNIPYEDTYALTFDEARELINSGQQSTLLDSILRKYKYLEENYDFVLCEGTDYMAKDAAFEFDLNADIAANINAPIILVVNGAGKSAKEIIASTQTTLDSLVEKGLDIVTCLVNRVELSEIDEQFVAQSLHCNCTNPLVTYVLPEEPILGKPTVADVAKWLDAKVLYGKASLDNLIDDYVIAAMQVENFLNYITHGSFIITPGDRSDLLLAAISSRFSNAYPDISGIVLTGGFEPNAAVKRLLEGWPGNSVPILAVQEHTFKTIQTISSLYGKIEAYDTRKIHTALRHFDNCVDVREITKRVVNIHSEKITPKMFEFNLLERAKHNKMLIVLPEGEEERVLHAADVLSRRGVADLVLLGNADLVASKIRALGLNLDATIIQPELSPKFDEYVAAYHEARKHKGISIEQARDTMADTTYFGTMMVQKGEADGMVSGAVHTTAHTIRPALEFVKTKPGFSIISSVFLMCLKDRVLVFGDCAVNPNPTAEQLAEIAIDSANTARIFGIEPRVAMLSYSTGASGKGADVVKIIEATRIAKERAPELLIEGPLQYDAAIDPEVARTKAPGSLVAGQATVFIFPDLNTGNNTYKAVQRAADAVAIGPVLQGLRKPVNDLSRGCTVPDIINTVAITAIQAQAEKGLV